MKIISLPLIWGYLIVAVAPSLSANMGKSVLQMMNQQNTGGKPIPTTVEDLTPIYSITCMIVAVSAMVFASIYPAVSLWMLSRPGVKAALVDKPSKEPNSRDRPLTLLLGPLAAPECSRASRRGWLIWVRLLPAIGSGSVAFVVLWFWWISQQTDPYHQPYRRAAHGPDRSSRGCSSAFAMILSPAVLAGSLAGEKERGSIGLLLTTRVNSADIVLGKLAGRPLARSDDRAGGVARPAPARRADRAWGRSSTLTLLALPAAWPSAAVGSRWRPRRCRGGVATRSCWST